LCLIKTIPREENGVTVVISAALQGRNFAQLQQNYPNEGGGFLLGQIVGETVTVQDVRPVENVAQSEEQYHRYFMTPTDWARLEDEADARNLTIVGYYHSHPESPAIPSEYDRVHALPNFTYLITSVRNAQAVEFRGWQLSQNRDQFVETEIHLQP